MTTSASDVRHLVLCTDCSRMVDADTVTDLPRGYVCAHCAPPPTHAPNGDPYRQHAKGCNRSQTISFELAAPGNPFAGAGHATYCRGCGAFLPCRDAIEIAARRRNEDQTT